MTKISIYSKDVDVRGNDRWIGSDAQNQNRTKNFTPDNVATYFNENQVIDLGVELRYFYDTLDPLQQRVYGSITFETEIGPQVNFSAISTFILSKYTMGHTDVSQFLDFLIGSNVILSRSNNINMFGYYKIDNIEPYLPDTNFFVVTLTFENGNGFMKEDEDYFISLVQFEQTIPATPTLQSVTDAGSTTTNTMTIDSVDNFSLLNADSIGSQNKTNNTYAYLSSLGQLGLNNGSQESLLSNADVTNSGVVLEFPDKIAGNYTIATTDDFTTPTLQSVTDEGNTTTTTVYLNGGAISESINEQASFAPALVSTVNLNTGSGATLDSTGKLALSPDGIVSALFASDNITQSITLQAPNKTLGSYTLATTDDIPAVTGYVPYTGATEDVNLGEFGLLTGNIEFDNTPTNIPTTAGAMYWNDADGTADLILKGGNVKLQIGQESVIRVVNKTATNINLLEANYQAVRVTGAQGQRLKVDLAQATTDNLSAETIGLVTETINNNQEGFITTSGLVRNINTTGSLQGETWADGDVLYLSPTTAGNVTKVKPVAPNHLVIIGYVVHAHANNGSIFVKVDNGYELDELHNVKITSAANNNVLAYTSATDIWENKTVETALGFTPENVANKSTSTSLGTSNTLYPTQNAVKVYADTKFTLPALTSGSVLFSDGTTIAQKNAQLFWDDTNNRLGVGTNAPAYNLDILSGATPIFRIKRGTTTELRFSCFSGGGYIGTYNNSPLIFTTNSTDRATIFANGNFAINTTTDAGFKLDVNGTARVQGAVSISGTTTINGPIINPAGSGYGINSNFFVHNSSPFQYSTTYIFQTSSLNSTAAASGSRTSFNDVVSWVQSSGTADFASFRVSTTINQTGTATGITRGLHINPTLTAAADFRAIEVANGITILGASTTAKASLRIPSGTAPTTPTNGDIWFDGTDLKMRIGGVTKTFTLL